MFLKDTNQRLVFATFSRLSNQPLVRQQLEFFTQLNNEGLELVLEQFMVAGIVIERDDHLYLQNDHYFQVMRSNLLMFDQLLGFVETIKPRIDEVLLLHKKYDQGFDLNQPQILVDSWSGNETFIKNAFDHSGLDHSYDLLIANALDVVNRVSVVDHVRFLNEAPLTLYSS
ncbi:MAG TPA: hypothetical protein GX741_03310 [Erysipelothrix sp.]|nr:hypothetical protein [Erysipelothrix sp.]